MDLWFCGLLPWQTSRCCSLLRRWLSVGCGFWGNLDNLGAWQQCNESYPFIAYKGTYQVSSLLFFLPFTIVFFPFSDSLQEWFVFVFFPIQWFTSRVVCFCVFPIQWFTSRVVCLDQNYSCKVHTKWTLQKLKPYEMTPFSLWVMLILCLPWRHTSRLTFFLFRIPNVLNFLQPASSKTVSVLELCLHCLWRKKANKWKPSWNQIWFCHASVAGVWSLVARPALTLSSPQHHPISPSGTSSHCQVCGRVRSVSQCIVLFVCVYIWKWTDWFDGDEVWKQGHFLLRTVVFWERLIWQSCQETDAVSLVMVIIHQKVSIFDAHVVSKQGLFVSFHCLFSALKFWLILSVCLVQANS